MGEGKKWFGIADNGPEILTSDELVRAEYVQAISQSKTALGVEVDLGNLCAGDFGLLPWDKATNDPIDIVIGDPRLVRNVALLVRGAFGSLNLLEDVRTIFNVGDNSLEYNYTLGLELFVFKTREGDLLYVYSGAISLLENVVAEIGDDFLEGLK